MGASGYGPTDNDDYFDTEHQVVLPALKRIHKILSARITAKNIHYKADEWRAAAHLLVGMYTSLVSVGDGDDLLSEAIALAQGKLRSLRDDVVADPWRASWNDPKQICKSLDREIRQIETKRRTHDEHLSKQRQWAPKPLGDGRWTNPGRRVADVPHGKKRTQKKASKATGFITSVDERGRRKKIPYVKSGTRRRRKRRVIS